MRQTKILSGAQLTLIGLLAFFLPSSSSAVVSLNVHNGGDIVNQHVLGNNLWVSVGGAQADTDYRLALYDGGTLVASRNIKTNAQGELDASLLWPRSGVVGCDFNLNPPANPALYRFETFEDAEALHGETFVLALENWPNLATVTQKNLPMVADTAVPRFYYSDQFGCPIFSGVAQPSVYISAIHLPAAGGSYTHWATAAPIGPLSPWPPTDIRPNYPTGLPLNPVGGVLAPVVAFTWANGGIVPTLGCVHGTVVTSRRTTSTSGGYSTKTRPSTKTGNTGTPASPNTFLMHPVIDPTMADPFNCPPCVDNMYP